MSARVPHESAAAPSTFSRGRSVAAANLVPLLFAAICAIGVIAGDLRLSSVLYEVGERVFRNLFLVLALVIPVVAGLGLNFAIVLGAMAGQIGLMVAESGEIGGIGGVGLAALVSLPIAALLGIATGSLFNKTRGREMIAGIILGFFASGVYQLLFLILAGPVIPLRDPDLLLPQGMGLRNTIDLVSTRRGLDSPFGADAGFDGAWAIRTGDITREITWVEIPLFTLLACVLLVLAIRWFLRTKLGQDLRAVGQDSHVAEVAGIRVGRCRIIAICLSMALAAVGQVVFLQNMGVMNTFTSHEQVGFYAIAALLVGGATVSRASVRNAVVGTVLFHALIVIVSRAAQKTETPQIGEYFREFFVYAIIGATLALHAWRGHRAKTPRAA
jgi:simple sugar transport system permease protein